MLENIIVCLAQSDEPVGPQLTPLSEIADVPKQFAHQGMKEANSINLLIL